MPYRLAEKLFVIRLLRFPDRFNMFLALPAAVLAAFGAKRVITSARRVGQGAALAVLSILACVVLFEYAAIPVPLQNPEVSTFYSRMADDSDRYAVLNLPIDAQKAKDYMYAQTVHQHPIMQGKTARFPEGTYATLDRNPWLHVLRQHDEMSPAFFNVSSQLTSLAHQDIRYVILHKTKTSLDRLSRWQRYLMIPPRFEDDQIAVYSTSAVATRDLILETELAAGIGAIRVIPSTDCLNPGRVWALDVGWATSAALGQDLVAKIGLAGPDGTPVQVESFPLSSGLASAAWTANTVAWGYYVVTTQSSLPEGTYTITLGLADAATGTLQGEPQTVGAATLSDSFCQSPLPSEAVRTDALFGDELVLTGYRLRREGGHLTLTLVWRSERRMGTDYKVFVHVFDPETNLPVAQDDAMPHRWRYPTTFWSPGETVTDRIPIALDDVPAGEYGLAVGIYDPVTSDRLAVVDGDGQSVPDGRLVLGGETIRVPQGP
jgi:hypothetical protein